MGDQNVRASDPRNYQLAANVSLWIQLLSSALTEDTWIDIGSISKQTWTPTEKMLDHYSNRRGVRVKDATLITERTGKLDFTADEINLQNLQFAFMNGLPAVGDNVDVHDNVNVLNPGSGQMIQLGWTDLNPGSVVVQTINLEDEIEFVENVDYTVDYGLGQVTIKPGGGLVNTDPVTGVPEIHIQFAKNVETQSFEVLPGTLVKCRAKIQVLTTEGAQYVGVFNNCVLTVNGNVTIGDGSAYEDIPMSLETLEDSSGKVGTTHFLNSDELP